MTARVPPASEDGSTKTSLILWVEDSAADITAFTRALADVRSDVALRVVPNAVDAFRYLGRRAPYEDAPRPDLVLLDLNLPAIDGHRVLEEIRATTAWRDLRVAVLTVSDNPIDRRRAEALDAAYHTKPGLWSEWLELARHIVEVSRRRRRRSTSTGRAKRDAPRG